MKAFVESPENAWSLLRIRDALTTYAPRAVKIVEDMKDADFVVLHVNGRRDRNEALADRILKNGQKYIVIQYCLRSTQKASTAAWAKLWGGACFVWSYLDLPSLLVEDGTPFNLDDFYYSPLGVGKEFNPGVQSAGRPYLIGTSGLSWLCESVREATIAAFQVGWRVFHLGPAVSEAPNAICLEGMNDKELAKLWASCEYVSGLRRTEGFEFPAAEGLVCGARPIMFDRRHYRDWYGELAEYIPEGSRQEVIYSLKAIFKGKRRPVKRSERIEAQKRFDWRFIILNFWKRCLDYT